MLASDSYDSNRMHVNGVQKYDISRKKNLSQHKVWYLVALDSGSCLEISVYEFIGHGSVDDRFPPSSDPHAFQAGVHSGSGFFLGVVVSRA